MSTRINVMFPDDLLQQLRDLIPERKRSDFIVGATRDYLRRERQRRALELTAGAWRHESNPNVHTQEPIEETIREMRCADSEREARLEALR